MEDYHHYSKPLALGHKWLQNLFDTPVVMQEKVDGSQFSFKKLSDGTLEFHSRSTTVNPDAPGMFFRACQGILEIQDSLVPGWTYRGECLDKPKHNTLAYDRVPKHHVIIFDVDRGVCDYLDPEELYQHCVACDLESVPFLGWANHAPTLDEMETLLDQESILGGVKIEGVVFKNYNQISADSKVVMGKYVSSDFKEHHNKEWKKDHPNQGDILSQIIADFGSEARWQKTVQHLAEQDLLTNSPQDIGILLRELNNDILAELEEPIKSVLFKYFWKDISRGLSRGFPEWYKQQLEISE